MLDSSNNLTLEEEVYSQNQLDSLAISEVKYEEKYNFLEEQSFHGDYLELSRLRLEPSFPKYQIHFYQGGKDVADQTEKTWSASTNQKIGTFKSAHGDKQNQCIKLPLSHENVLLQINSCENSPLRGKLLKSAGDTQIILFDHFGKEKGKLSYHLEEIRKKENDNPGIINESITLQEKDFLEDIASIKKNLEEQNEKRQKIEVNSRNTLKTQQNEPLPQENSDDSEERSQKSDIDYMGYEGENSRVVKAAEYRLPLQSKSLYREPIKAVDFSMIKKSMDSLGLPNNHNLQKFLERKRVLENIHESVDQPPERQSEEHKSAQILVQSLRSYHDFSSQVQKMKPELKDYGVGTYTPISSRMVEQRIGSSTSHRKSQISVESIKPKQSSRSKKKDKIRLAELEPIPQTQLHRPKLKQRYSPISHESIKHEDSIIKHGNQLSMRNKVYEIRVGSSRAGSRLDDSKRKEWGSCKDSSSNHPLDHTDSEDSILYPQFDFCINNLSVNFHQQSFGSKFVELTINPTTYRTEELRGSNLIWIGKSYLFRSVNGHCQLVISVKTANEHVEETLGKVRVRLSDIVLNRKKSYFQTFLLGKQSVLAIVIIGFQVAKRALALERRPAALKLARQSHAQTQFSRSKTTKVQRKAARKANQPQNIQQSKLPQPRANPIRSKKYVGGRNIKIGRASRFQEDGLDVPGPGDYYIESSFSRHALKDY